MKSFLLLLNILMKAVLILCVFVAIAESRPQFNLLDPLAKVLQFNNDVRPDGFSYNSETSNGIKEQAQGRLNNVGTPNEALEVAGSYSYIGPDGKEYYVEYTAGENGFEPAGTHLPPSAGVKKLGIPSSAVASLAGGGLG